MKHISSKTNQPKCLQALKFKWSIINKLTPITSTIIKTKNQCIYLQFQNNQYPISIKSINTHNLLVEVLTLKILVTPFCKDLIQTSEFKKLILIMTIFQTAVAYHWILKMQYNQWFSCVSMKRWRKNMNKKLLHFKS